VRCQVSQSIVSSYRQRDESVDGWQQDQRLAHAQFWKIVSDSTAGLRLEGESNDPMIEEGLKDGVPRYKGRVRTYAALLASSRLLC
jgi:hypothetical protein